MTNSHNDNGHLGPLLLFKKSNISLGLAEGLTLGKLMNINHYGPQFGFKDSKSKILDLKDDLTQIHFRK